VRRRCPKIPSEAKVFAEARKNEDQQARLGERTGRRSHWWRWAANERSNQKPGAWRSLPIQSSSNLKIARGGGKNCAT
jgi:hypothetical protein